MANRTTMQKRAEARRKLVKVLIIAAVLVLAGVIGMAALRSTDPQSQEQLLTGKHYVQIDVKDYGSITAELDADTAPITVTNFINLTEAGFYNGLTFHRIIPGFMIQGGDPKGNGTGGSEKTIMGEFSANGVKNDIKHTRGVLSMARSSNKNSASSQFFIMHEAAPHLDGQYAAFGQVISGMEVVDAICAGTKTEDDNGTVARANQPVIERIVHLYTATEE